ncbi:hypothetical protein NQZ68_000367 [Dissostichus eleginoides]|nr:hypothetical protein NQZ68_000367 [Dissostichus eleginoides]
MGGLVIVLVSGLAVGQEPLVRLQWVRRLTEPQQSQYAAWDIDRLEPEGSCRIGTHCQRLGYHQRLPASQGGRGNKMERPESLAVVALGGLCRGRGCVEQQHRKRVKVPRANWNQMSEATGRGILTVEQERQRGKFASP